MALDKTSLAWILQAKFEAFGTFLEVEPELSFCWTLNLPSEILLLGRGSYLGSQSKSVGNNLKSAYSNLRTLRGAGF